MEPIAQAMSASSSTQGFSGGLGPGGEPVICNACKQGLDEALDNTVVSFGKYLFHVDCFRCAKCHNLVEHNTNLLLLSDGSPVCENCSYICNVCQKPIHNEAIVTGDESYHADCFRCRSCSNRIEELIFAKTQQGIWCMACHNERVARTRKHAEAKRKARKEKEKEKDPSAPRASRSRSEGGRSSSVGGDADRTAELPDLPPPPPLPTPGPSTSAKNDSVSHVRPLPPSPYHRSTSFDSTQHQRSLTNSSDPSRLGATLPPSSSVQSISSLSRSATSLQPPSATHSRTPSQASAYNGEPAEAQRRPTASALRRQISDLPRRQSDGLDDPPRDFSPYPMPESPAPPPHKRREESEGLLPESTSRNGSLSAPSGVDKAANRRSGFYGAAARPSLGEDGILSQLDDSRSVGRSSPAPPADPRDHRSHTPSTSPPPPLARSASQDLHASASFYDPDTLLFLNHVGGSAPSSPKLGSSSKALPELTLNEDHLERIPSPGPVDVSGDEDEAGGREGKSEVARRVRESIQMQKRESSGRADGDGEQPLSVAGLDVELVEMLLSELESTKREMKELKSKYNAFRRASRSAFEGFSLAREEYDKEVAARREAEAQMELLRTKFIEQARRLAQVDQEQKTAESLKRQSKDLRNSVIGMEKHLSQLKAEVALSTAQVAELTVLGEETGAPDRSSLASTQDEVAEALNSRLEAIKDAHRDEISALVAERDDLMRQVAELKQVRDAHLAETTVLETRNVALAEKNADATRQIANLQESLAKMQLLSAKSPAPSRNGHMHSPSNASLLSSVASGARSPLATARYISSPGEGESMHRFARPEVVETSSRNKFWGKSKGKSETSKANQQLPPPPPGNKSPVVSMRAGSIDSNVKQHVFQQTSILRPVRCDYCGDKMWGLAEVRCTACGSYAHAKCAPYLTGCHPGRGPPVPPQDDTLNFTPTGPPMFTGGLATQADKEGSEVPVVVTKCIAAVEAYGMTYEGIYRKTGGMGQTKLITQYFERGQDFDLEDRDKFNDIAAITSCLKNYFRSLPNPLMTHELHEEFIAAAELPEGDERLRAIERVLYRLPPAHFHTARLLFRHLNRIKSLANENKMTSANLGVVFGPTVLRSPIAAREWSDMGPKAKLVEILCDHADSLFSKPYAS
ncbi:RHTO0S27e00320g1_1 [Rhodotorula toruloides]|uniref:RHTO0S27e00320g1_1 n=1 Tax=Rhodotorula toruloides TaxID=5286 RepID=A0A061BHM4_RHOTO|nr:RHTO0S27e00320g1_1 [Rhodotorula toruloides]